MSVGQGLADRRRAHDERSALLLVCPRQEGHRLHDLDAGIVIDIDAVRILLPAFRGRR